jgi:putative ABC transport system permease protein
MAFAAIALKNLNRQKKRSYLLGGAIAFGVLIVTLIDGFSGAFMRNVSENFSNIAAGHLFVEGSEKTASGKTLSVIHDDTVLMDVLGKTGIPTTYISKRSIAQGTLIFESRETQITIQGVDFANERSLTERLVLAKGSVAGMGERQGLVLSEQTATSLNAQIGDRLLFQLTTVSGQQNVGEMVLAATTPDNGLMSGYSSYANLSYLNELLDLGEDEYQTLGISLPSLSGMDHAADLFYAALKERANVKERTRTVDAGSGGMGPMAAFFGGGATDETWTGVRYRVFTLNDLLSSVKQIVNVLDMVSIGVLVVLFVIIMVGILNTFRMTMYERIREIGTMRALGMLRSGVRTLFLMEALFLALAGVAVGMAGAALVMGSLSLVNLGAHSPLFILLRAGHLSFHVPLLQALENIAIVAALTLVAAYIPARAAARLSPAQALRTTK